jgi:hypothetical protein
MSYHDGQDFSAVNGATGEQSWRNASADNVVR